MKSCPKCETYIRRLEAVCEALPLDSSDFKDNSLVFLNVMYIAKQAMKMKESYYKSLDSES